MWWPILKAFYSSSLHYLNERIKAMLLLFGFPMPIHDMMKFWSHLLVDEVGGSNWQLGLIDCSNTTTIRLDRQFFSTVNDLKGKDVKTVSYSCINISLRRQNFEFLIFFCSKFEISKNWGWAQLDIATEKKILIQIKFDQWMKCVFFNCQCEAKTIMAISFVVKKEIA